MGDFGTQVALSRHGGVHGASQVTGCVAFQDTAVGTRRENGLDVASIAVAGKRDHPRAGIVSANLSRGLDPVQIAHRDVHDDDVGLQGPGQLYGFPPASRFSDHRVSLVLLEQSSQSFPNHLVIVDQEYADTHDVVSGRTGTRSVISVPCPSADSTRTRPPSDSMRTSTFCSPNPKVRVAGTKPTPRSAMTTVASSPFLQISTREQSVPECFATLISSSRTALNREIRVASSSAGSSPVASTSTLRP